MRIAYCSEIERSLGEQQRPNSQLFSSLLDSLEANDCDPLFQRLALSIMDQSNGQIPRYLISRYNEIRDQACTNLEKKWPNSDLYRLQSQVHS